MYAYVEIPRGKKMKEKKTAPNRREENLKRRRKSSHTYSTKFNIQIDMYAIG